MYISAVVYMSSSPSSLWFIKYTVYQKSAPTLKRYNSKLWGSKQTYVKTETCKLYSRVLWTFQPNVWGHYGESSHCCMQYDRLSQQQLSFLFTLVNSVCLVSLVHIITLQFHCDCISVCLCVCLPACLSVCLCICVSVCFTARFPGYICHWFSSRSLHAYTGQLCSVHATQVCALLCLRGVYFTSLLPVINSSLFFRWKRPRLSCPLVPMPVYTTALMMHRML